MSGTKTTWWMALVALVCMVPAAGAAAAAEDEHAAIEAAVRDYVDGWYAGDAARMERALHPDLAKRSVRRFQDGGEFVDSMSASGLVAYTAKGFGKGKLPEGHVNEVTILAVSGKMAAAKSVAPDFVDFLHLAKFEDGWKIVNVLWEPVAK